MNVKKFLHSMTVALAMMSWLGPTIGGKTVSCCRKTIFNRLFITACSLLVIAAVFLTGCTTIKNTHFQGGTIVPNNYHVPNIIVTYQAGENCPARIQYFLIETAKGLAIFERSEDGSGALFQDNWQDENGDHFVGWVSPIRSKHATGGGPAYEYIVPLDRSKEAKRIVYPKMKYKLEPVGRAMRPISTDPEKRSICTLVPK